MRNTNNPDIREKLRRNGIYWYEVAGKMGISEATLYRKLRKPLDYQTAKKIETIIAEILSEREA